jgi:hypothetical protein
MLAVSPMKSPLLGFSLVIIARPRNGFELYPAAVPLRPRVTRSKNAQAIYLVLVAVWQVKFRAKQHNRKTILSLSLELPVD